MVIEQVNAVNWKKFTPYLLTLYPNPETNLLNKLLLPSENFFQLNFKNIFDINSFFKLFKLLKQEKFEAVITNLFDTNLIVRIAAIFAGIKIILSYEHSIYENKKLWQKLADYFLAYFTNKIIVGSGEVKKFTSAQEKIPLNKFVVNYNSAKLNFHNVRLNRQAVLAKNNLPKEAIYIVTAGRLTKQKGHKYLIEAAKEIVKNRQQKIIFLIYGQGELEEELKGQIKSYCLENAVYLKGLADMEEILAISDIFVLSSLWEGLSIALVQAMNAGCPIVATRVSGTEEVVENEISGLLAAPRDVENLASALGRLIENSYLREKLGRAAQKKSEFFSIEDNIKKIEDILFTLIKNK